jgi:hypothetical protein
VQLLRRIQIRKIKVLKIDIQDVFRCNTAALNLIPQHHQNGGFPTTPNACKHLDKRFLYERPDLLQI